PVEAKAIIVEINEGKNCDDHLRRKNLIYKYSLNTTPRASTERSERLHPRKSPLPLSFEPWLLAATPGELPQAYG
ncbi:hypothetical protein ACLOJK_032014, partial [Asimina triloba]